MPNPLIFFSLTSFDNKFPLPQPKSRTLAFVSIISVIIEYPSFNLNFGLFSILTLSIIFYELFSKNFLIFLFEFQIQARKHHDHKGFLFHKMIHLYALSLKLLLYPLIALSEITNHW